MSYERVQPSPNADLRTLLALIEQWGNSLKRLRGNRLLIDMRGLRKIGDTELLILVHHCAIHMRVFRVATLVDVRTGRGERLARSMGLELRSFEQEQDALAWLASD